jgi:D-arabinonate dehydratase
VKITDVKASLYREKLDMADFGQGLEIIVTEILTDEGITGTGFTVSAVTRSGSLGETYLTLLNKNFKSRVVGMDALASEEVWRRLFRFISHWGRRGLMMHCLSMIDIALWDIRARKANMPLWQFLGGPIRERIPCYANAAYNYPPEKLAQRCADFVKEGFKAVKIRGAASVVSGEEATTRVKLVREAIGPDIKLMVDVNGTWDPETALQMLRRWEPYQVYWIEEPVHPDNLIGFKKVHEVAKHFGVNIAAGEEHGGMYDFRELILQDAVDVVQPDTTWMGGITEFLRVTHLAQAHDVRVSPHMFQNVNNHLIASQTGTMWVEYFVTDNPMMGFPLRLFSKPREAVQARGGMLDLTSAPGLGLEMDPETAARCLVSKP